MVTFNIESTKILEGKMIGRVDFKRKENNVADFLHDFSQRLGEEFLYRGEVYIFWWLVSVDSLLIPLFHFWGHTCSQELALSPEIFLLSYFQLLTLKENVA